MRKDFPSYTLKALGGDRELAGFVLMDPKIVTNEQLDAAIHEANEMLALAQLTARGRPHGVQMRDDKGNLFQCDVAAATREMIRHRVPLAEYRTSFLAMRAAADEDVITAPRGGMSALAGEVYANRKKGGA